MPDKIHKGEGDINLSLVRRDWQEENLDYSTRELLERDNHVFLHQSLSTPCLNVLNKSYGIYLEDLQGRKIMDFHGNNVHQLGFGHESVIAAVKDELDGLPFCTRRYTNKTAIELAEKLVKLSPGSLDRVLFAPGATSAVGMALKLARLATGKFKTLSMWSAFHGASMDALSVGGEALFRENLGPLLPGSEHVLPFDSYRPFFENCDDLGSKYAELVKHVLENEGDVGAVIVETIRNTDVMLPDQSYLQKIRQLCNEYGALLILDETAVCLGRTGKMFAYEHYDIIPDMVIIGKGLGGGVFPMAALIAKEELNVCHRTALGHYTHEKSPVGSAAALATINYIEENKILDQVNRLSAKAEKMLHTWQDKYECVGDVRVMGLLFGVEIVTDKSSKKRDTEKAEKIMYQCLSDGLSFKVSKGNVLTLSPPLIIKERELLKALEIVENAIKRS